MGLGSCTPVLAQEILHLPRMEWPVDEPVQIHGMRNPPAKAGLVQYGHNVAEIAKDYKYHPHCDAVQESKF